MSIFGNIVSAIFGHSTVAAPAVAGSASGVPAASGSATGAAPAAAGSPMTRQQLEETIGKIADEQDEKSNWKQSIVDLMKLLNLDSSLTARKELANELNYAGNTQDSAAMNIWLHKQVMIKLAENGGKVPDSLKT